jgi:Ca2+-binding RTX toxin-like protein
MAVIGLAAACLLGLQLTVSAPIALAVATCSVDSTIATVHGGEFPVTMSRSGDDILMNGSQCGTVTTIDTVNIVMESSFLSRTVTFDLSGGLFAPGANPEGNTSSEIEFDVTRTGVGFDIVVAGSASKDNVALGQRRLGPSMAIVQIINLNVSQDQSSGIQDDDVLIHEGAGGFSLEGNGGNDKLSGDGTGSSVSHPLGHAIGFKDGPGADTLVGGAGDDFFRVEATPDGGDGYTGKGGDDTLVYTDRSGPQSISQDGLANDGAACPGQTCEHDDVARDIERIDTGDGNDRLVGGTGPQTLSAGGGDNRLFGGPGNDTLFARTGKDAFHGGPGFDTMTYEGGEHNAPGVHITIDGVADDGLPGENDNIDRDVESVVGSEGDDVLIGNHGRNRLEGSLGDDTIRGLGGRDSLDGGGSAFSGFFFVDHDGSDELFGGPGVDTATLEFHFGGLTWSIDDVANDEVTGRPDAGVDNIHIGIEDLVGNPFSDDHLTGDAGPNRLAGGGGKDVLVGLGGNDVMEPGAGDDTAAGGQGLDTAAFTGSAGPITANLKQGIADGDGHDALMSIERLAGSSKSDHLGGSAGPNDIRGGAGDDSLFGFAGDDRLLGGPGDDSLDGGPGSDTCKQGPGTGSKVSCEH